MFGVCEQAMQSHCLVFRDAPTLQEGMKKLDVIWNEMKNDIKVRTHTRSLVTCLYHFEDATFNKMHVRSVTRILLHF